MPLLLVLRFGKLGQNWSKVSLFLNGFREVVGFGPARYVAHIAKICHKTMDRTEEREHMVLVSQCLAFWKLMDSIVSVSSEALKNLNGNNLPCSSRRGVWSKRGGGPKQPKSDGLQPNTNGLQLSMSISMNLDQAEKKLKTFCCSQVAEAGERLNWPLPGSCESKHSSKKLG